MGEKAARVETGLTVKECAALFQSSPKRLMSGAAKFQGFAAKLSGGNFTADFFTPSDSSPFAALNDDPPAFAAGTYIRNGASAPNPTELHMYVWDRGARREVAIVAGHGLVTGAMHAKKVVHRLAEMFASQDRTAKVSLDV
jgi:hypothetical protein